MISLHHFSEDIEREGEEGGRRDEMSER